MRLAPRLPLLIWRSITGELARILAITCLSLLAVISFAGAVKPLAEGDIGLADALKLTLLLLIPMLQFALPFAAGFASTISYHRMASDNEAIAGAAGGVSHRAILVPAFITGALLAIILGVLANNAIPTFLRRAEQLVHRDITRLLVAPIKRGMPIRLGNVDVYANDAIGPLPAPKGSGAIENVVLKGVVAVQSDKKSNDLNYYAAQRVDVLLFEDPDDPSATGVQLVGAGVTTNSAEGSGHQRVFSTKRVPIRAQLEDNPKFMSFAALHRLREHPRRLRAVDERARRLSASLVEDTMIESLRRTLADHHQGVLVRADRRVIIGADRLERDADEWRLLAGTPDARITITVRSADGADLTQWAARATLQLARTTQAPELGAEGTPRPLDLHLENVVTDPGAAGVERAEQTYAGLVPVGVDTARWDDASVSALLAAARERARTSDIKDKITRDARNLRNRVEDLDREIESKVHERIAYSVACFVMVLTGAVVALRMRESLPLPVYLWSFFPALLAVITISTGQRLTHNQGASGLFLLWGGVAALVVYTLVEFARLRRH